jgi:hypothetical protein
MWQTVVVLLVLLGVSIYLVRHFVRVYRAEAPTCAGCAGCCSEATSGDRDRDAGGAAFQDLSCQDRKASEQGPLAQAGKPAPRVPVLSR